MKINAIGKYTQNNKGLIFLLKDSIWYAIIMRIAKICDEDKEANNIKKIVDYCKSNNKITEQKRITHEELDKLYKNLKVAITDESGKAINLIKCWRDKYAAHYSKLTNPLDTQKKYLITDKKMEKIINTLTNNTITVSNYANTTLSFIKVPYNDAYIIDTLGFINSNDYNINYKKQIKPRCYQLKENYELLFLNFKINMDRDNNLTFYINNDIEVRKKKRSNYLKKIWVNNNSDLIIKG